MVLKTGSPKELSILLVHWQSPICIKSECLGEGTLWFRVLVVFKTPCWVKFTIMTEMHWYWMNMEAMWSHTEAWLIYFSHYPKIYTNTDFIGWAVIGIIKTFGFASFPLIKNFKIPLFYVGYVYWYLLYQKLKLSFKILFYLSIYVCAGSSLLWGLFSSCDKKELL